MKEASEIIIAVLGIIGTIYATVQMYVKPYMESLKNQVDNDIAKLTVKVDEAVSKINLLARNERANIDTINRSLETSMNRLIEETRKEVKDISDLSKSATQLMQRNFEQRGRKTDA